MKQKPRPLAAAALIAVATMAIAGCSSAQSSADTGAGETNASTRAQVVKFSECMRDNGVSEFPDPDASGDLTMDSVANGSSVDTGSAAFKAALDVCRSLKPPGFTGHERSEQQQEYALKFAQCMRDHGVKDFPDPTRDGPLIDTNRIPSAAGRGARDIPGFDDAAHTCGAVYADQLGIKDQ